MSKKTKCCTYIYFNQPLMHKLCITVCYKPQYPPLHDEFPDISMKKHNSVITGTVIPETHISVSVMTVLFGNDISKNHSIIFYT